MAKQKKKISLGYAWYALFVMFMINMFNYVDRLSLGPAMEHLKRYFDVTDARMGWILGAFTFVYAIVSLPMGFLSDRGKRTFFVGLGAFVWSIAATTSGFCKTFTSFFTARAAVGSGEGIYAPTGSAIIADYFPRNQRATAISIFMSAMLIGGALALVVAGMILSKTDKFDLERTAKLVPYEKGAIVEGWTYEGQRQTKDRLVSYDFKNGADTLSVVLSKPDLEKKSDAYTKLFNVDFRLNEKSEPEGTQKTFAETVTKTIAIQEGAPLKVVSSPLKELPTKFKVPEEYKGLLHYDKANKNLVYNGIMTVKDKKMLRDISDNPKYQNALVEIYSYSAFYYRRSDNWKWIFWLLGPPGIIFALLAFMLREPVKGGTEDYLTEEQALKVDAKGSIDYSPLWKTPSLVIMMLSNVIFTAAVGGLNMWLFPFVERYKDIESSKAAMQLGPIVIVSMLVGVILSGIVSDKMFKKSKRAYNYILFICITLSIPFLYIFVMTLNYYALIASVTLGMFLLSWVNGPQNTLLVSVVDPKLRATMNAVHIVLIHCLGDGPSPIIIGALSDKFSLKFAFMLLPIALFVGGLGFLIAGYFVPKDLQKLEDRMKKQVA